MSIKTLPYSKKSFYFYRTGYGYLVELRECNIVARSIFVRGHTNKSHSKLKKLADEWTGKDWDISYFKIKRGYQDLQVCND